MFPIFRESDTIKYGTKQKYIIVNQYIYRSTAHTSTQTLIIY